MSSVALIAGATGKGWPTITKKSVFYQLDLQDAAKEFVRFDLATPDILKEDAAPMVRIHNRMLRGRIMKLHGDSNYKEEEQSAFQLLRDGLLGAMPSRKNQPVSMYIQTKLYGDVAPSASTWQEGGQIPPPYSLFGRKCCQPGYRIERTATLASICETMQRVSHRTSLH